MKKGKQIDVLKKTALIGFGLLIMFRNVAQAVALVRVLLFGGRQAESLGPLATASLAVSTSCRASCSITQSFCESFSTYCYHFRGYSLSLGERFFL